MAIKPDTQKKLGNALGDRPSAGELTDAIDANTTQSAANAIATAANSGSILGVMEVAAMNVTVVELDLHAVLLL